MPPAPLWLRRQAAGCAATAPTTTYYAPTTAYYAPPVAHYAPTQTSYYAPTQTAYYAALRPQRGGNDHHPLSADLYAGCSRRAAERRADDDVLQRRAHERHTRPRPSPGPDDHAVSRERGAADRQTGVEPQ